MYWFSGLNVRIWVILLASLSFYGFWRIEFIPLMVLSALIDFYISLAIGRSENDKIRKRLLWVSLILNISILCFFKYLVFFRDAIWSVSEFIGYKLGFVELNIILPLGISFYIFQTMSYTIDVYRRNVEPETNVVRYICFVTFFPQLVAGPILRASTMLPQLRTLNKFSLANLFSGMQIVLVGLFLKVVLADTVAPFVDAGFSSPALSLSALDGWTLAFLFGFQIYFDFAGYSAVAIGSAMMFGYCLPVNFNFPYAATSPRNFWQRWHISLSTWIRDYLYLPLIGATKNEGDRLSENQNDDGKKRVSSLRSYFGLYITWSVMGLWHGANWTFVLWGVYHACLISVQRIFSSRIETKGVVYSFFGAVFTLPLMMAAWIAFRAESVSYAIVVWSSMLNPYNYDAFSLAPNSYLLAACLVIGFWGRYFWVSYFVRRISVNGLTHHILSILFYTFIMSLVFVFLQSKHQFIYFQF